MTRAILHIGMHKTGSSSIQETLFQKRYDLRDYFYIEMGRGNSSSAYQHAFLDSYDLISKSLFSGHKKKAREIIKRKENERAKLTRQLAEAKGKNLIISAEGLLTLTSSGLRDLKSFLQPYCQKIEVAAYIRPPKSYISSAFQQKLKSIAARNDLPFLPIPEYRKRLEKFERVFGPESVHYWLFDRKKLINGCVVTDFCSRIGLPLRGDEIIRINDGLSLEAVKLLYLYRRRFPEPDSTAGRTLLTEKLGSLGGGKFQFTDHLLTDVLEELKEEISWMEERLGRDTLRENKCENDQAISSWELLERLQPSTLEWLSQQTGAPFALNNSSRDIAQGVRKLRDKLRREDPARRVSVSGKDDSPAGVPGDVNHDSLMPRYQLDLRTILKSLQINKSFLKELGPKTSLETLRALFATLLSQLDQVERGSYDVEGLGAFTIIRAAEANAVGRSGKSVKIFFNPAK